MAWRRSVFAISTLLEPVGSGEKIIIPRRTLFLSCFQWQQDNNPRFRSTELTIQLPMEPRSATIFTLRTWHAPTCSPWTGSVPGDTGYITVVMAWDFLVT